MATADWSKKTSDVPEGARRQWRADRALRPAMRSPGSPTPSRAVQRQFWCLIATGISSAEAALSVGVSVPVGMRWFRHAGGMPPLSLVEPSAATPAETTATTSASTSPAGTATSPPASRCTTRTTPPERSKASTAESTCASTPVPCQEDGRISGSGKLGVEGSTEPRWTSSGLFQARASCGLIVL